MTTVANDVARRRGNRSLILFAVAVITLFLPGCSHETQPDRSRVNFAQLDAFCQPLTLPTTGEVRYLQYQANKPDFQLAPANPAGVGTVEDAARGLLAYLRWYELTGDSSHFANIRGLAKFLLAMQTADGRWHNWVQADGSPGNAEDEKSPAFAYPAAKAIWALGRAFEVLHQREPQLAYAIAQAFERALPQFDRLLANYPKLEELDGLQIPMWLPYRSGADAASEMLLGILAFRRTAVNGAAWQEIMEKFSAGIAIMQQKNTGEFAYGMHFSFRQYWHGWSNSQVQALAEMYNLTGRPEQLQSAQREADHFFPWLLQEQFAHSFDWLKARANRKAIDYFPQRVEHIRPMVLGLLALQQATGEAKYAEMAGQAARWLTGDNLANEALYDPKTGRARSYIQSRNYVIPDITAAATAEALLVLMEVEANPVARAAFGR